MEKSDMLECIINYYTDGNKARFAAIIGVKPQTINTWVARNTFDVELIYSKCDGISGDWLLGSGKGDMIKGGTSATANGDGSIVVNGNNNSHVIAGGEIAFLQERITHLEELLAEKERLISVLMEKK
ncbi:MAG: hypothetical protein Q4D56_06315 [Bacteroides sp.]|nr:hypothetical protein [Bacteroides sp.]